MFCSRCGKTLPIDAVSCPHCDRAVGESRFDGSPYTAAQSHIPPGVDVRKIYTQSYTNNNYTRTNYTSAPEMVEQGDVDSRTTYRPAYGGDSIPEDMRAAVDSEAPFMDQDEPEYDEYEEYAEERKPASDEAVETLSEMDKALKMDDIDMSQFRAKPIESVGQTGISADVTEMMQQIEAEPLPRQRRSRRPAIFGGSEEPEADNGYSDDYDGESYADEADAPSAEDQPEVFDDIDEEEFEELRHSSFGLKQILKIVVALIIVAALFVGGVMWINYIRGNQSDAPIENVSEDFYAQGVALIKDHASTEYINKILAEYSAQGSSLTTLDAQLQQSAAAVRAILPAEPTENETLFLEALNQIENNIANCLISDAMALSTNDAAAIAESDDRWSVVENSIIMLEGAKSAAELTAIINGEVVDVVTQEATPTPEPMVNYDTLSKGDRSDEVLRMQTRLYDLGYLKDTPDGDFGTKTQTAVKIFQQLVGLPVTGIADNATLNALYADDAPKTALAPEATLKPIETPPPTAEPVVTEPETEPVSGDAMPVGDAPELPVV